MFIALLVVDCVMSMSFWVSECVSSVGVVGF